jgi:2-keto-4-pentenoate hydratase/2-oxohepta-3-ene-1,7-dioic acid hydratase in catechol pathway
MRWVRYERGGGIRVGRVEGDLVREVEGDMFGTHAATSTTIPLAGLRLLPPVIPPTFYAAGVNYRRHLRSAAEKSGQPYKEPTQSHIGYRAVNALIGDGEAIEIPRDSCGKVQFEGELVVVIGRKARRVSEADALSCVFGYTIGNDVSEREWQRADRTFWRAKNADTFKPMGPWIETDVRPADMATTIRLNGDVVSTFVTNDMVFGVATTISEITRYITLVPGDVIWMGTDDPTLDMVPGDTVEVEIDGIGVLRNPVRWSES